MTRARLILLVFFAAVPVLFFGWSANGNDGSFSGTATPAVTGTPESPRTTPAPISVPGPKFNVLDYGAKGDGVADDSPAIGRAFNAADKANGGTVLLPSAHTYLIASGWNMKPIRTNDWLGQVNPTVHRSRYIDVSGYGATIKYARDIGRVGWLQSGWQGMWTTQGKLIVEGMVIDNNYAEGDGEVGRVLWLHDANAENITVRNIVMKNVTPRTAHDSPASVTGIFFKENFPSADVGHRAFFRNITILDSSISAQEKAIEVGGGYYGSEETGYYGDSPLVVDNIDIERVHTDNNGHLGSGIHLGGYSSGGTAKVIDVTATNSADNLVEINAFNDVTVKNVKLSNAAAGVGFTWYSFPYRDKKPVYRIINATFSGRNKGYWPTSETTEPPAARNAEGTVFVGQARRNAASLLTRTWGDLIIGGGDFTNGSVNPFYTYRPAIQAAGAFSSVTIENTDLTDIDTENVGGALLLFNELGGSTADLTIRNVNYRTSLTASFVPLPSSRMSLRGSYTLVP